MQIKTSVKYHLISVRLAITKIEIINVGEDVKKNEHFCTVGKYANWHSYCVK
jgi:hypothetical protein